MEGSDLDLIINYFLHADLAFLAGMGVDPSKFPSAGDWHQILYEDLTRSRENKAFYYVIWEVDDTPIGHSNINKIIFGQEAFMHLHLWNQEERSRGHGTHFIRKSISWYFKQFQLEYLYCETYALNPAPNKTLPKVGFEFVETYTTVPGWINLEQSVNRWILTKEKWGQESLLKSQSLTT